MPAPEPATASVSPVTPVTAIVVIHRVNLDATTEALASLKASTGVTLRLIVVYNGDGTGWPMVEEMCSTIGATAIRTTRNEGFGAAVNSGLALIPADDAVFLMNDDARVEPTAIWHCLLVLAASGSSCVSVAPMVVHHEQPTRIDSMGVVLRPSGDGFNAYQGRGRDEFEMTPIDILGPSFSAALFRPGAFDDAAVGPLATRYFLYYEDVEWNIRARHRGYTSVAAPAALAVHRHALSTRTLGEDARFALVQRNRLVMALATLSRRGASAASARWLFEHAKGTVRGPYRAARIRAALGAVRLAPWALRRRRTVRGPHPAADATLFAYSLGHQPAIDTTDYSLLR